MQLHDTGLRPYRIYMHPSQPSHRWEQVDTDEYTLYEFHPIGGATATPLFNATVLLKRSARRKSDVVMVDQMCM
jgi:hypothetical protein